MKTIFIALTIQFALFAQSVFPPPSRLTCSNGTCTLPTGSNLSVGATVLLNGCTGVDDTTLVNNAITAAYTAGGGTIWIQGTCKVTGQISFPNDGSLTIPKQPAIRIMGAVGSADGTWPASLPSGAAAGTLDLTYNAPVAKILTLGSGTLELSHLTLKDSGSDCAAFIQTTYTMLRIHDVTFSGTASGTSACNDAVILGGTTITGGLSATAPFQGYGTIIKDNWFHKIRRGVVGQVYANSTQFLNNTFSSSCGSNQTAAVTAATNAGAAVLTSTAHNLMIGRALPLNISGFTGNWTPANGYHVATIIGANTFSIAVDSTSFGAMTGTPVFLNGAAIDLAPPAGMTAGNIIAGNLIEQESYPFAIRLRGGTAGITGSYSNYINGNQCWDVLAQPISIACVTIDVGAVNNFSLITMVESAQWDILDANATSTAVCPGKNFWISTAPAGRRTPTCLPDSLYVGGDIVLPTDRVFSNSGHTYLESEGAYVDIGNARSTTVRLNNGGGTTIPVGGFAMTGSASFRFLEGSNKAFGTATLSSGTATVSTTAWDGDSRVILTLQNCSSCGTVYLSASNPGTSFTITSTNGSDASTVLWWIVRHY